LKKKEESQKILGIVINHNWDHPDIGKIIPLLWRDNGIRETYPLYKNSRLNPTAAYFFEKVEHFSDPNYTPSTEDILRARVRTTAVSDQEIYLNGIWNVVLTGGQRSERRKWSGSFDGVFGIIFCVSLFSYDLNLREDPAQNSLVESLYVFQEMVNSPYFTTTPFHLVFTMRDLFLDKILISPISTIFPEYSGEPNDPESVFEWIVGKFLSEIKPTKTTKALHVQVVNTLDIQECHHVIFSKILNPNIYANWPLFEETKLFDGLPKLLTDFRLEKSHDIK